MSNAPLLRLAAAAFGVNDADEAQLTREYRNFDKRQTAAGHRRKKNKHLQTPNDVYFQFASALGGMRVCVN